MYLVSNWHVIKRMCLWEYEPKILSGLITGQLVRSGEKETLVKAKL